MPGDTMTTMPAVATSVTELMDRLEGVVAQSSA